MRKDSRAMSVKTDKYGRGIDTYGNTDDRIVRKGVELIWKQCNEELYPQGTEYRKKRHTPGMRKAGFSLATATAGETAPSVSVIKKHTNVTRKA
ncbi:MAG: hypothetical protein ACLUOI_10730 [Eisenbergiella sp.]